MPPRQPNRAAWVQAIADAEAQQQRGERRKGQEAIACLELAVAKYQEALGAGLPPDDVPDALFGTGWCYQLAGDAVLHAARSLPDDQVSWGTERVAREGASDMYTRSCAAYQQVLDDDGHIRDDAAVNCGNALCALAELLTEADGPGGGAPPGGVERACGAYEQAAGIYTAALARVHDADASTWSNLADCVMSHAQLLHDSASASGGQSDAAEAACRSALQSYERSCSLCDSTQGDDLPGLLCNWGSGLLAAASILRDPNDRANALVQAGVQLTQSSGFAQGDPEPLVKLGDVYSAQAEVATQSGRLDESATLLRRAIEDGYTKAITLRRDCVEGLVGAADAHAALAKLAAAEASRAAGAGAADAAQCVRAAAGAHWAGALQNYNRALSRSTLLGSFGERCDVRFNAACALALAGQVEQVGCSFLP
ncbi:hypothetical protein FOA52_005646 [Chlamydomonas sp. UWO 241]|nr:hypothetical protein FOA52_005646 [Chlamydomonas sp. UWO 241]